MASAKLAEGEELGSNLLRVDQSSPGEPGGSGSFKGGPRPPSPRSDRSPTAYRAPSRRQPIVSPRRAHGKRPTYHITLGSLSSSNAFTGSRFPGENVGTYTI